MDLQDVEAEVDAVGDGDRLPGEVGEHQDAVRAEHGGGLGAGRSDAGEVEGDVDASARRGLAH
ncbi:hypothetical protein [Streptomyces viridosporus]|uniref:hypothetical protein n=1 Tax=Streptomyces viridosporus TaxID=67581 RepID=UPI0013592CE1|nr:hypothetical protein [Streptomyces viridosporus]